jgi:hypothetical protein
MGDRADLDLDPGNPLESEFISDSVLIENWKQPQ